MSAETRQESEKTPDGERIVLLVVRPPSAVQQHVGGLFRRDLRKETGDFEKKRRGHAQESRSQNDAALTLFENLHPGDLLAGAHLSGSWYGKDEKGFCPAGTAAS